MCLPDMIRRALKRLQASQNKPSTPYADEEHPVQLVRESGSDVGPMRPEEGREVGEKEGRGEK